MGYAQTDRSRYSASPIFSVAVVFFSFDLSVRIFFFCVCAVNYFAIMPFEWQHSFELCTGDSRLGLSAATMDFFFFSSSYYYFVLNVWIWDFQLIISVFGSGRVLMG